MTINKQVLLASRPQGEPTTGNFRLVETEVPALADGQVLVRNHFLSLDPYMRGRMNDAKSYAAPQPLDQVMIGGTVGEIVESRNPAFQAGDKVPMHSHPDIIVYIVKSGKVKFTNADGKVTESKSKAGEVLYRPAVSHSQEHPEASEAIVIELKK